MTQFIMEEKKKILNLCYDRWDYETNTFKYNGGDKFIFNFQHLLKHFVDESKEPNKFEVKSHNLSEVYFKPDLNFYYPIAHGNIDILNLFVENEEKAMDKFEKSPLSEEVIECLQRCKNLKVIIITEHEPDFEIGFIRLLEYLELRNLDPKQFYVINNNERLNDLKIKHNTDINVHTLHFIAHSSNFSLTNAGGCEWNTNKMGKFFMCFNKTPKHHRYALLCLLKKEGLLDKINWSLVPTYDCIPIGHYYNKIFTREQQEYYKDEINFFNELKFKRSDMEEDQNWFNKFQEPNTEGFPAWMRIPEFGMNYENSYINIVTESKFFDDLFVTHISEKSYRPFFYYQLPMILTTQYHIKTMKEKYNFDFFDDIINHSYDNEPNQMRRLEMFVEEIKRLDNIQDEVKEFYKNNKQRFEDNKQKVWNMLNIVEKDYKFFESLI